jgi:Protein of unknown function (DUF2934)
MQGEIRKCLGIPVITVESSEEHHQEIILSAITKRAYQIFEEREHKHGFGLDDWLNAEKELWRDDDLDGPDFSLVVDCPPDREVTTILSLTTHSLVVFRSRKKRAGEANRGPDVQSVHQFSEEINPALAKVKPVNGTLHVCLPKKNHASSTF